MKRSLLLLILSLPIFSIAQESQLGKLMENYQKKIVLSMPSTELSGGQLRSFLNLGRKAPYAMLYEHTGLYRWQLLPQCYYKYEIDSSTSILKIDVDYRPNSDLFPTVPAYFQLYTRRPYSLDDYKSVMVTAFKSLGTNVTILTDKPDDHYGHPGHEYCQSYTYGNAKYIIYSRFVQVNDISCVVYYLTLENYYNNALYKIFFDVILEVLEFKPFSAISNNSVLTPLSGFGLCQNYPNPFNSITKIDYDVKEPARLILEIFDLNGAWVKTVFNRHHEPGNYSVTLNFGLPTGIYFYRLSDGSFYKTRPMILVK